MFQKRLSDKKLLQAVARDGERGWALFCKEFDPLIRGIVGWSQWDFTDDVKEDITQEIYLGLQIALPRFRRESKLSWYIKRIAMNCCIDEVRRQARQCEMPMPINLPNADRRSREIEFACPNTPTPRYLVVKNEQIHTLREVIKQLHETCQTSITLRFIKNHSYQEISEQLGITVNTVGSRLAKCLQKLKKELVGNPLFERIPL